MASAFKQALIVTTENGRIFRIVTRAETFEEGRRTACYQAAFVAESPAWDSCRLPVSDSPELEYGMRELE